MTVPSAPMRRLAIGPLCVEYRGDAATQLLGVLGHPVQQSRSPRMQQAALDAHGSNLCYVTFAVAPTQLASFVQGARSVVAVLRGFNVTVPHKTTILPLLDALAPTAQSAGAVNTVVIDSQGCFQGHNSDIAGVRRVWHENGVVLRNRTLVILGAGGLARAAVVAGLLEGVGEIRLLNRTITRAQSLLDEITESWQDRLPRLRCVALNNELDAGAVLQGAVAVVQATSLGMHPDDATPLDLDAAPPDLFVLESIYARSTALLQQARQRQLPCVDGLTLLLYQGAASWRLWMQTEPDLEAMRRALWPATSA